MTQACAIWRGDIGAYIVGALDAEASARVRRHLRACRACRDDFHDLVPVRDWLGWLVLAGEPGTGDRPGRPPLEHVRSLRGYVRGRLRRRWLPAAAATAAALGSAAVAVAALSAHPAVPAFRAFDRATGVHGQARLTGRPNGTEIDLTVTGLPADERCTLVVMSRGRTRRGRHLEREVRRDRPGRRHHGHPGAPAHRAAHRGPRPPATAQHPGVIPRGSPLRFRFASGRC